MSNSIEIISIHGNKSNKLRAGHSYKKTKNFSSDFCIYCGKFEHDISAIEDKCYELDLDEKFSLMIAPKSGGPVSLNPKPVSIRKLCEIHEVDYSERLS